VQARSVITIVRRLAAPVAEVYRAWTEPRLMQMWLGDRVDADVTVGGRYRIENDADDGVMYAHEGEYLVLEPEDRIVQTFEAGPVGDDSNAESPYQNEYPEITLTKLDDQTTELTFENAWDGPA